MTKEIIAPISKAKIVIKDWITGAEAEYIEQALFKGLDIKPDAHGGKPNFGKFDASVVNEQTHREYEKFIVSVNGETSDILKKVMELPEEDCEFIQKEINERRKKKIDVGVGQPTP